MNSKKFLNQEISRIRKKFNHGAYFSPVPSTGDIVQYGKNYGRYDGIQAFYPVSTGCISILCYPVTADEVINYTKPVVKIPFEIMENNQKIHISLSYKKRQTDEDFRASHIRESDRIQQKKKPGA